MRINTFSCFSLLISSCFFFAFGHQAQAEQISVKCTNSPNFLITSSGDQRLSEGLIRCFFSRRLSESKIRELHIQGKGDRVAVYFRTPRTMTAPSNGLEVILNNPEVKQTRNPILSRLEHTPIDGFSSNDFIPTKKMVKGVKDGKNAQAPAWDYGAHFEINIVGSQSVEERVYRFLNEILLPEKMIREELSNADEFYNFLRSTLRITD